MMITNNTLAAFQLAQSLLLIEGIEIYSKREVADNIPELEPFMYRKPEVLNNLSIINKYKDKLINYMKNMITIPYTDSLNICWLQNISGIIPNKLEQQC